MIHHWQLKKWEELSVEDLYRCLQLRIAVFIVEQNCPYHEADDKDRKSLHLFTTNQQNEVIAYLRLLLPGVSYDEWSIGRVATDISHRRSGLGKELMKYAMEYLSTQHKNPAIRISAQAYLEKFYSELGFKKVSEEYLEDNIPHIEMLYTPMQ